MCQAFAEYGFYQTLNEIKSLTIPLVLYLEGVKDIMTPEEERSKKGSPRKDRRRSVRLLSAISQGKQHSGHQTKNRYKSTEESLILIKSRTIINETLQFLGQIITDLQATLFLIEFRKSLDNHHQHKEYPNSNSKSLIEN